MDLEKLVAAVLTPLVAFAVRWLLAFIGVEVPDELFGEIVLGIVTVLLALMFGNAGARGIRSFRTRG